jgi:hypothetical protein
MVDRPDWQACGWVNAEMIHRDMQRQQGSWCVPYLRRLVAGVRPRRQGVDPRPVLMGFGTEKVTMGQDFL